MTDPSSTGAARRASLGALLAAALLWLLFRDTDGREVAGAFVGVEGGWFLLAQALIWISFFVRVQRWAYVVRPVQAVSHRNLFSATQIGLLFNFTIPARLGELVRAYVLARLVGLPVARGMALVALDRVNDVTGLLAVLLVAALALAGDPGVLLPPGSFGNAAPVTISAATIRLAAWILAGGVLAASLVLVLLYTAREQGSELVRRVVGRASPRLAERLGGLLASFAEGLHALRSGGDLARALFWSLLGWGADVAAVAALLEAFHLEVPWYAPFVVVSLVAVSLLVPLTPGAVGQFHLSAVVGLLVAAPEVAPVRAKAVALVEHLSTLLPIVVLGVYCLLRERLGFLDLLRRAARLFATRVESRPRTDRNHCNRTRATGPRR